MDRALKQELAAAVAALRQGGVIAYPTEAVYGLGCDPSDEAAVARLFALKQRPPTQGVLLIAADFAQVEKFIG
ncbi:MAG TPA: Sua5/YciO/YrdC/YwlC family protein, partial [Rhodanobacteraceae bacterium]|nr:Sua5/YciO/YrdC/YwlC family protein [Rhodanobacteraceae bacterium]